MKNSPVMALYLFASLSMVLPATASAQVDLGSANVASTTTTEVNLTLPNAGTLSKLSVVTAGSPNQDFTDAGGGTCTPGTFYPASSTCTVEVQFAPRYPWIRYGAIVLLNSNGDVMVSQRLQGLGQGPKTSFSLGTTRFFGYYPNPSINVGITGTLFITSGPYGSGGSAVSGSLTSFPQPGSSPWSTGLYRYPAMNPHAFEDQAGNAYSFDAVAEDLKDSSAILPAFNPTSFGGDASGNLFVVNGDNSVLQETLQANPIPFSGSVSYVPTAFATGSRVWLDLVGNVYVLNGDTFSKYLLQPDNVSYVKIPILTGLATILTVDGSGNVYGYIPDSPTIYKETLQPDGSYVQSLININNPSPANVAVDEIGNTYYSQTGIDPIFQPVYKEDFTQPGPVTFAQTAEGSTSSDSPQTITITNRGNLPLQFSEITYPLDFPESPSIPTDCATGTALEAGKTCTLSPTFAPLTPLNVSVNSTSAWLAEKIKIVTNSQNNPGTEQDLPVYGTETIGPAATPAFSVPGGSFNNPVSVAITSATPGASLYYTLNGTAPTTASTRYTGPVMIRGSYLLQAIAAASGANPSQPASATFALVAAAPVLSPAGGSYTLPQSVTISSTTSAARFLYTTNGTTPNGNSTVYTGPISVSASETLKVIAIATGYTNSPVVAQTYTIPPPAAIPTFSVPGGTYNNAQTVALSDTTPGATFYYTLNGTTPTTASMKYTAPIVIRNSYTLQAIATAPGYRPGGAASASYSLVVGTPVLSLATGTYTGPQTVSITSATTGAHITYTLNGTTPTGNSTAYTGPIPISNSKTLKVLAFATGYASSPIVTATYTIQ